MKQLCPVHEMAVRDFGIHPENWWRAEQVHGNRIAIVPGPTQIIAPDGLPVVPNVDGLVTNQHGLALTIYVADCGAIWLADRKSSAIGLLHSGKKGTESNILGEALSSMKQNFGTNPEDVTAVLSPCIRPPDYEIDFAAEIKSQAKIAGIGNFIDCDLNTASDLSRFYSYRREVGKTGRMMAMLVRDFLT
ncbi:MAG: polyphenol oxidase family protein [Gloeobacteraceae cyanobacterium ES-bin-144]|nr:polyphenol oxidase family protein [Verrucomicrobiales bacterium]